LEKQSSDLSSKNRKKVFTRESNHLISPARTAKEKLFRLRTAIARSLQQFELQKQSSDLSSKNREKAII
jgi:hypothetical protein